MNNMEFLKGAVIFILGVGAGATGTYLFIKDKYEKELNEELASLRQAYSEKKESEIEVKEYKTILAEEGYTPYESMCNTLEEVQEHVKKIADDAIEKSFPPEDYPSEPVEITEAEYSEDELYFEKVEADYYLGDGALVDEADEMLNIDDNIGYENIERFIADEAKEVIYIRNAEKCVDYLINKVSGNYSEIIGLGGDDED